MRMTMTTAAMWVSVGCLAFVLTAASGCSDGAVARVSSSGGYVVVWPSDQAVRSEVHRLGVGEGEGDGGGDGDAAVGRPTVIEGMNWRGLTFQVSWRDLAEGGDGGSDEAGDDAVIGEASAALLEAGARAEAVALNGGLERHGALFRLEGRPAGVWTIDFERSGFSGRQRLLLVYDRPRLYGVSVRGARGGLDVDAVDAFFGSFSLAEGSGGE